MLWIWVSQFEFSSSPLSPSLAFLVFKKLLGSLLYEKMPNNVCMYVCMVFIFRSEKLISYGVRGRGGGCVSLPYHFNKAHSDMISYRQVTS